MDERFFLYFDEADLSYRAKKAGYKVMYVPSAKVYHRITSSMSGKDNNPVVLYYGTRNELLFARKHLNPIIFFPLWVPRFIFRIFVYCFKAKNVQVIKSIINGFLDFTRNNYGRTISPSSN